MANLVPINWSADGVAEGRAAEAEVRVAMVEAEVAQQVARAVAAEGREVSHEAEIADLRAAIAEVKALSENAEFRALAAESRAANAEAKLTTSEARAAIAEAQLKIFKEQVERLQREANLAVQTRLKAERQSEADRKKAEVAENMLKSADDFVLSNARVQKLAESHAESRVRVAEAKCEKEQRKADERVQSADRRAQMCEASASLAITGLQRHTALTTSGIAKPFQAVHGKVLKSPTSSASTSATTLAESSVGQLHLGIARRSISPPSTPRINCRTYSTVGDWSPSAGKLGELSNPMVLPDSGQVSSPASHLSSASPSNRHRGTSPSNRHRGGGTPVSMNLRRSQSPIKGAFQQPTSPHILEIRAQLREQAKNLTHY